MDPSCCCDATSSCCCNLDRSQTYTATISAPDCGAAIDGKTVTLSFAELGTICEGFQGFVLSGDCGGSSFNIGIVIRCNPSLSDRGGGSCDFYEMKISYMSSDCDDVSTTWTRVKASSCSCSPLSLVFEVPSPQPSGMGTGCDCCTTTNPITVTVTA